MKIKIYDQIITDISESIKNGTLKPDDKLPTYTELANTYHTSAVTVRKSLTRLINDGLLYSINRVGVFVKKWPEDRFLVTFSEQANISDITHTTIESIHTALITLKDNFEEQRATEVNYIAYSDIIPIYYCTLSLLYRGHYNIDLLPDMTENNLTSILDMLNSFEVKKELVITMEAPQKFIQKKLMVASDAPMLSITLYYYTLTDKPIGKSVTYIAGENIDLYGKSF